MQGKDTTKSTLNQLARKIANEELVNFVKTQLGVDRYTKKLEFGKFLVLMILAQLRQCKGLREISSYLEDRDVSKTIGLESIHASSLSRRLADLPAEALRHLFFNLKNRCIAQKGLNFSNRIFGRLHLIDSTTISLCLRRYGWANFRKTKSGIKAHLRVVVHEDGVLADKLVMTEARPSDKTQMDALVVEDADAINVFDRAYLDYKKFDLYCEKNVRFVTRLKANAIVEHEVSLPLSADSVIKSDSIVTLGNGKKRMEHPLRLLEKVDTEGKPIRILTNVTDLTAEEIGDVYRYRWQIELFFKWIKQHLTVKHFFGQSHQAVENQLFIALITHCLLGMLREESGCSKPFLELKRLVLACLHCPYEDFLKRLHRKPSRHSKGRRKLQHDLIFEHTYEHVMAGDTDFLHDTTYDPIIL